MIGKVQGKGSREHNYLDMHLAKSLWSCPCLPQAIATQQLNPLATSHWYITLSTWPPAVGTVL